MSMRARATSSLVFVCFLILSSCGVPPLESQMLNGPRVNDITDHINCELASVVNTVIVQKDNSGNTVYYPLGSGIPAWTPNVNSTNPELLKQVIEDHNSKLDHPGHQLGSLLAYLVDKHFVASAQLTLDVLDTEGFNPSLSFITPFASSGSSSSMFNYTSAIGGSLSGTQERNIGFGYSIDFDQLSDKPEPKYLVNPNTHKRVENPRTGIYAVDHQCPGRIDENAIEAAKPAIPGGITGDLGLTAIIVDGLVGLDATKHVNIYSATGPTPPAATVSFGLNTGTLSFTPVDPYHPDQLNLAGSITFTPPTGDPHSPGSATLTASGSANKAPVFVNLTGSTVSSSYNKVTKSGFVTLSLSGPIQYGGSPTFLGFSPQLNLVGRVRIVNDTYQLIGTKLTGYLTPDTKTLVKIDNKDVPNSFVATWYWPQPEPQQPPPDIKHQRLDFNQVSAMLGAPGGGGVQAKGAGAQTSGSGTQFSSYVNFILAYGLNGGPNWTLQTFKGPSGGGGGGGGGGGSGGGGGGSGGGGGGQFLSANQTRTDSLTITFVAACQDSQQLVQARTYWDTLPVCDSLGLAKANATSLATQFTILSVTGKGQF